MKRKGAGHYGLNRKLWPKKVRNDFERFFRFSRYQESIDGRSAKEFRDRSSEKAYQTVLSAYLGFLADIRKVDISDLGLREMIANEDWVIGFVHWHKTERGGGRDRDLHQTIFSRFAILLEEMWCDPISSTYREYMAQIDPVRKDPRFEDTLIPFLELLAAAKQALKDAKLVGEKAKARGSKRDLTKAAVAIHDAFLFAYLILRPLRESNIVDQSMDENLVLAEEGGHVIVVSSAEEKGEKPFRIKFPESLEEALKEYVDHWRPILNRRNDRRLFMTSRGGRLTPKLLGDRTAKLGQKYLGIKKLNPHFFRALVVSSYLADYPNQFEMARQLLGHRHLETTLRYYIHIHALHASRRAAQFARDTCEEFRRLGNSFGPSAASGQGIT
jgi:integrase